MRLTRALSVRQPYAELILRGRKKIEYRTASTRIRERVYIYASQTPGAADDFSKLGLEPGDLPTGVIVGTVEIVGCTRVRGKYHWRLARPKRLARSRKPRGRPQPVWFHPFPQSTGS